MTQDQFRELMQGSATARQRNIGNSGARYKGTRNHPKVQELIANVELYKELEGIPDGAAKNGLQLVLQGEAHAWWMGVKENTPTWRAPKDALIAAFAPKRSTHVIFVELFKGQQPTSVTIESFITAKRALIPELTHPCTEGFQIDTIYGMLRLAIRRHVTRETIDDFKSLIDKARQIEALEEEAKTIAKHPTKEDASDTDPRSASARDTRR